MIRAFITLACVGAAATLAACGGPKAQPNDSSKTSETAASASAKTAASTAPNASSASSAKPTPSASASAATDDDTHDDPNESAEPIAMKPLLTKATPKSSYPKKTTDDAACWKTVGLTGKHDRDYDSLIEKCGAPTGLAEYAKPVHGKLHHKHDKRDTFILKLAGGLCYRFFAVADGNISDLDILILKPNGALVGDDKTTHPVAIIESHQPWCMDTDVEYHFAIEVDGPGKGGYTFGVWARPK